jgi:hypothetical protein
MGNHQAHHSTSDNNDVEIFPRPIRACADAEIERQFPPLRSQDAESTEFSLGSTTHSPSRDDQESRVVAWSDLPRKDQLIVITLARLSEPLTQTSLQSYLYYQLKWFDPSLPNSVISSQAGIIQ